MYVAVYTLEQFTVTGRVTMSHPWCSEQVYKIIASLFTHTIVTNYARQ